MGVIHPCTIGLFCVLQEKIKRILLIQRERGFLRTKTKSNPPLGQTEDVLAVTTGEGKGRGENL